MATTLSREDTEQLRLLVMGHYVVAGLQALFGLFPVIHLVLGIWMVTSPETNSAKGGPPPAVFGVFLIMMALVFIAMYWTLAGLMVAVGKNLARRRRRNFCMIVDGIEALMCMPFGTVLGVLTIVVLMRPSVREAFEQQDKVATG